MNAHDSDRQNAFLAASLLCGYPDAVFRANMQELLREPGLNPGGDPGWEKLRPLVIELLNSESALEALRSDYIDLFDRSREANPLYETEYGRDRSIVKGNDLADIAGFYRAFGLKLDDQGSTKEILDHVAVELEFYALLLRKQTHLSHDTEGTEVVLSARRKFLQDHLGRFVGAIAARPAVARHAYYAWVFSWCAELVTAECARLGITPVPLAWDSVTAAESEVCCGAPALLR
ncbi:MAG: molecular chaperone TorD family protein [Oligoflexia bacterium]|nr:molecular chaperone TorD family protein [Oligoflexia bacterium]